MLKTVRWIHEDINTHDALRIFGDVIGMTYGISKDAFCLLL